MCEMISQENVDPHTIAAGAHMHTTECMRTCAPPGLTLIMPRAVPAIVLHLAHPSEA